MHPDKFWKYFWSLLGPCLAVYSVSVVGLLYAHSSDNTSRTAAVEANYDPTRDPFQKAASEEVLPVSDYLYRDSLSLGFKDWSWEVSANWRSAQRHYEGSYSLRAEFLSAGGDVRANTPRIDLSPYASLSLAVYPESVADVYLELYDADGNPLGKQSVAWYARGGVLIPKTWNFVTIPLINLTASSTEVAPKRAISGFSINSKTQGIAFIDALRFEKGVIFHPRYEETVSSSTSF